MQRLVQRLALIVGLAIVTAACSSEPTPSSSEPPVFDNPPTPEPTAVPVEEPTITADGEVITDDERVEAALTQLLEVDLEADAGVELLDAGIYTDTIEIQPGNRVVIEACSWRSKSIRQRTRIYTYIVDDDLNATLQQDRTVSGPECMNSAILASAGEFAAAATVHFGEYSGDDGDSQDPALADYWHPNLIESLREGNQRSIDGFRVIRFTPNFDDGGPVAWAHHESAIELVIALRYDYNPRYGTYDTRTDVRIEELTPQIPPDDLVGDDHVFEVMLWWEQGRWRVFAIADLYGIDCVDDDCVDTLERIGQTPNRPVHRTIDFASLKFVGIGQ